MSLCEEAPAEGGGAPGGEEAADAGSAAAEVAETWVRKWLEVRRRLARSPGSSQRSSVRVEPPKLALRLFPAEEADHYAREWRAHLSELAADGQLRQARRHRRRLAMRAPLLALELRVRAFARRQLRGSR